jgi:hypothetical protein
VVGVGFPGRGGPVAGHQHDHVDRLGLGDTVAVLVAVGELAGQHADGLVVQVRVESYRGQDHPLTEVRGAARVTGFATSSGSAPKSVTRALSSARVAVR